MFRTAPCFARGGGFRFSCCVRLARAADRRTQAGLRPCQRITPSVQWPPAKSLKGRPAASRCFGREGGGSDWKSGRSKRSSGGVAGEACVGIVREHVVTIGPLRAVVRNDATMIVFAPHLKGRR